MKLQAEITGFEAVQKKLEKAGAQAGYMALARKGADEGGEIMLRALQDNVPYDTHWLQKHLDKKVKVRGLNVTASVGPMANLDYPFRAGLVHFKTKFLKGGTKARLVGRIAVLTVARYLEFGTSKMPAIGWMSKTFDSIKEQVVTRVTATIQEGLEKLFT